MSKKRNKKNRIPPEDFIPKDFKPCSTHLLGEQLKYAATIERQAALLPQTQAFSW